ncbi:nucleoporin NUP42 [Lethenteron reissneri]|uniref:nucleoporin NUP42 n=1 Tax=Lethenteron reissneri TaxID=7753 RepID=UPI002AB66D75|nr:nucleoporin NUP42 [Lethenteron reissneri]
MVICRFFLQGFCRFGDRCWNEHPASPQQSGYSNREDGFQNLQQHQGRGGGLLPTPNYNRGGRSDYHGGRYGDESDGTSYGRNQVGGFGGGERGRSGRGAYEEDFGGRGGRGAGGFQSQRGGWQGSTWKSGGSSGGIHTENKFSALSNANSEMDEVDEIAQLVINIKKDMEHWESSGLWYLSCYAPTKERACITGFIDLSPEEIRLEYYKHRMSNLQEYLDMVSQLKERWRQRKSELANPNSRDILIAELIKKPQALPAFGISAQPCFNQPMGLALGGFSQPASSRPTFTSNSQSLGFGESGTDSGFATGAAPAFGMPAIAGSSQGFEVARSSTSASSFNFSLPSNTQPSPMVASQPAIQAANFSFSLPAAGDKGAGLSLATTPTSSVVFKVGELHTPNEELTQRDLQQFQAKKFMFTKIPLKPPTLGLLRISI